MPRRFVSWAFVVGFGLGSFVGVAMALLAVALAKPASTVTESVIDITATPLAVTATAAAPSATPTPSVRTVANIEVRIGPGEAYAIIGSIGSNDPVSVLGRDDGGDWVAISYPPGSAGKGWLPATSVTGLSGGDVTALAVLVPTPFSRALSTPTVSTGFPDFTPSAGSTDSTPVFSTPLPGQTPIATPTRTGPQPTATTRPLHVAPTDLTIVGISVASDGGVVVSIGNAGPGDVSGSTISVLVSDGTQSETLFVQPVMRAGDTVDLETSRIRITRETEVTATIDPNNLLADIDRSNNQRYATLAPRPTTSFGSRN